MPYYSTIQISGKVKEYDKERLELLNNVLAGKVDPEEIHPALEIYGFKGGRFEFCENGKIELELEEYTERFYEADEIAEILSTIIKKGYIRMVFIGEDGEIWGYFITPNSIKELTTIIIPKEIEEKVKTITEEYIEKLINNQNN